MSGTKKDLFILFECGLILLLHFVCFQFTLGHVTLSTVVALRAVAVLDLAEVVGAQETRRDGKASPSQVRTPKGQEGLEGVSLPGENTQGPGGT